MMPIEGWEREGRGKNRPPEDAGRNERRHRKTLREDRKGGDRRTEFAGKGGGLSLLATDCHDYMNGGW